MAGAGRRSVPPCAPAPPPPPPAPPPQPPAPPPAQQQQQQQQGVSELGAALIERQVALFAERVRQVLLQGPRDDDRAAALAFAAELRADGVAVVASSCPGAYAEALVHARQRRLGVERDLSPTSSGAAGLTGGSSADRGEAAELVGDVIWARWLLAFLLFNDTWQHHDGLRRDTALAQLPASVVDLLADAVLTRLQRRLGRDAQSEGRRRACEVLAEVLGQLSRRRFGPVAARCVQLAVGRTAAAPPRGAQAERDALTALRLLRALRPPGLGAADGDGGEGAATRASLLRVCAEFAERSRRSKPLKHAVCDCLAWVLSPAAACGFGALGADAELLAPLVDRSERWVRKPKHAAAAAPLAAALLCGCVDRSGFAARFSPLLQHLLRRLQDDKRGRAAFLEAVLHMLGFYLTHCTGMRPPAHPPRHVPPPPPPADRALCSSPPPAAAGARSSPVSPPPPPGAVYAGIGSEDGDEASSPGGGGGATATGRERMDREVAAHAARVTDALAAAGRRQPPAPQQWRQYLLATDVCLATVRLRPEHGVAMLLKLLPASPELREVLSENTLVGLSGLLASLQLSRHTLPQGAVEEHGSSQGVPLWWWSVGPPTDRLPRAEDAPRLRCPFSSLRAPSPALAASGWRPPCAPALPAWAGGPLSGRLLLDTSALCAHRVLTPEVLWQHVAAASDALSQGLSQVLLACERELCPAPRSARRVGSGISQPATPVDAAAQPGGSAGSAAQGGQSAASGKWAERPAALLMRLALLCTPYILPRLYSAAELSSLLGRLCCSPQPELRQAVCSVVLPQLLLWRPGLRPALLLGVAEMLLPSVGDADSLLQLLQVLIVLLRLWGAAAQPRLQAGVPALHPLAAARGCSGAGELRGGGEPDAGGDEAAACVAIEGACLALLCVPLQEVRAKSLCVLQLLGRATGAGAERAAAPAAPLGPCTAAVLHCQGEAAAEDACRLLHELRRTGADWSDSSNHRRLLGLLPLPPPAAAAPQGAPPLAGVLLQPDAPAATPEALRLLDGLQQTPLCPDGLTPGRAAGSGADWDAIFRAALFAQPAAWPVCLAAAAQRVADMHPCAAAAAHHEAAARLPLLQGRAAEAARHDPHTADGRRAVEHWQACLLLAAATSGCSSRGRDFWDLLGLLLHSSVQDFADAAVLALAFVPPCHVGAALSCLRAADADCRVLAKKEKNRRAVWLLRGHIAKGHSLVLSRMAVADCATVAPDIVGWLDQQLDLLPSVQAERFSAFDHLAFLRWRADLIGALRAAAELLHAHHHPAPAATASSPGAAAGGAEAAVAAPDRLRRWLAAALRVAGGRCPTRQGHAPSRSDNTAAASYPAADRESQAAGLAALAVARARSAVGAVLSGPLPLTAEMPWWLEQCAAGADPEPPPSEDPREATFGELLRFLHRLVVTGGSDDPEVDPARRADAEAAQGVVSAMLRCNPSSSVLVRASAALSLHPDPGVAALHLRAAQRLVAAGASLPPPAVARVLAATLSFLHDADPSTRRAARVLLSLLSRARDAHKKAPAVAVPPDGGGAPDRDAPADCGEGWVAAEAAVAGEAAACAAHMPEAGSVLVALARERLPRLTPQRSAALLAALPHWAAHLRFDTPGEVDEALALTRSCVAVHAEVCRALWRQVATVDAVVLRMLGRCAAALSGAGGGGHEAPAPGGWSVWSVCQCVLELFPPAHRVRGFELLAQRLPSRPLAQSAAHSAAAVALLCHHVGPGGVDAACLAAAAADLVHGATRAAALSAPGHWAEAGTRAVRLLAALCPPPRPATGALAAGGDDAVGAPSDQCAEARRRLGAVLSAWGPAPADAVTAPSTAALLCACRPCGVEPARLRAEWAAAALRHASAQSAGAAERAAALRQYAALLGGRLAAPPPPQDAAAVLRVAADGLRLQEHALSAAAVAALPALAAAAHAPRGHAMSVQGWCWWGAAAVTRAADAGLAAAGAVSLGALPADGLGQLPQPVAAAAFPWGALAPLLGRLYQPPVALHQAAVRAAAVLLSAGGAVAPLLLPPALRGAPPGPVVVGCLMPDLCCLMQRGRAAALLETLAAATRGPLQAALRQQSLSRQSRTPGQRSGGMADFIARVSDALAECFWGASPDWAPLSGAAAGAAVCDFWLRLVSRAGGGEAPPAAGAGPAPDEELVDADKVAQWVLRAAARVLRSPPCSRPGSGAAAAFAPLLRALPSVPGVLQPAAAPCLSLAVMSGNGWLPPPGGAAAPPRPSLLPPPPLRHPAAAGRAAETGAEADAVAAVAAAAQQALQPPPPSPAPGPRGEARGEPAAVRALRLHAEGPAALPLPRKRPGAAVGSSPLGHRSTSGGAGAAAPKGAGGRYNYYAALDATARREVVAVAAAAAATTKQSSVGGGGDAFSDDDLLVFTELGECGVTANNSWASSDDTSSVGLSDAGLAARSPPSGPAARAATSPSSLAPLLDSGPQTPAPAEELPAAARERGPTRAARMLRTPPPPPEPRVPSAPASHSEAESSCGGSSSDSACADDDSDASGGCAAVEAALAARGAQGFAAKLRGGAGYLCILLGERAPEGPSEAELIGAVAAGGRRVAGAAWCPGAWRYESGALLPSGAPRRGALRFRYRAQLRRLARGAPAASRQPQQPQQGERPAARAG